MSHHPWGRREARKTCTEAGGNIKGRVPTPSGCMHLLDYEALMNNITLPFVVEVKYPGPPKSKVAAECESHSLLTFRAGRQNVKHRHRRKKGGKWKHSDSDM